MSWIFFVPSFLLLTLAAWRDVATRTIPDGVCMALAAFGLVLRAAEGWPAVLGSLAATVMLFAFLVALHARGFLGGGDVKLLTAVALGLPPLESWNLIVATSVAGGALACLYLALQRLLAGSSSAPSLAYAHSPALRRVLAIEARRIRRRGPMPYGVAIAIGGAIVLLHPLVG